MTRTCGSVFFLLVLLFLPILNEPSQGQTPVNDSCANALPLALGVSYTGSTAEAGGTDISSCANGDTMDVWHRFTPASDGRYFIDLCDSRFDTTLAVYDGCGGSELACNDDDCLYGSRLSLTLTAGTPYCIRVSGFGGASGEYAVRVDIDGLGAQGPINDDVAQAIPLTAGIPYSGTTDGATGTETSSCATNDTKDVWHRFAPNLSTLYRISLCNSDFDTTLQVFDGMGGLEITCNDDACGTRSESLTWLSAGHDYLIRIAGFNETTGDYTVSIMESSCLPASPRDPGPSHGAAGVIPKLHLEWHRVAAESDKSLASPKVIYGIDDRLDEYQVTDADWRKTGDGIVAIIRRSDLSDNGDGTYTLSATSLREAMDLCPSEPFGDQPRAARCSGFLVATDMVATAGHCIDETDYAQYAFVFGFVMEDADTAVLTFPHSQVYFAESVLQQLLSDSTGEDWAVVRLDRPVSDHAPLRVRRSGTIADNAPLFVIGHPVGIPRKYAGGASVVANGEDMCFTADLDTYSGNSGSAVINRNTLEVEGILVRGQTDFEYTDKGCRVSKVCPAYDPDSTDCDGEEATRVMRLAALLPVFDVYLGESPDGMAPVCENLIDAGCDPGILAPGTTYYWQVIAKNDCGHVPGPIWTFNTGEIRLDAIIKVLRLLTGDATITEYQDVDLGGDGVIGMAEAIYMMQFLAGIRP